MFITKNGYSDLVIMSIDTYERSIALLEIYNKLDEAEEQFKLNLPTKSHKEIVNCSLPNLYGVSEGFSQTGQLNTTQLLKPKML